MSLLRRASAWLLPRSKPPDQVSVAIAGNEAQAEMMSQLLRQAGIPSNYRLVTDASPYPAQSPGARRDIIVNAADAERAASILSPVRRRDDQPDGD
jgi:hypothetical protein